jgi:hypothetical protein
LRRCTAGRGLIARVAELVFPRAVLGDLRSSPLSGVGSICSAIDRSSRCPPQRGALRRAVGPFSALARAEPCTMVTWSRQKPGTAGCFRACHAGRIARQPYHRRAAQTCDTPPSAGCGRSVIPHPARRFSCRRVVCQGVRRTTDAGHLTTSKNRREIWVRRSAIAAPDGRGAGGK